MILSIPLSQKGKLLIKPGQNVDFNTPLYKDKKHTEVKVQIASKLHIPPSKIFKFLKKVVGDEITKGELLAEKKSFLSKASYKSEHDGVIKEVDHVEGLIVLEISSEDEDVSKAFFKGEVEEIEKQELKLKVEKIKEYDIKDVAYTCGGPVFFLENEYEVFEEDIDGRVVIAESISAVNQIKIEALGAIGFITQKKLINVSSLPSGVIKEIDSWKELHKNKLPYCLIDKKKCKIILYQ